LSLVELRLCRARHEGALLIPDENSVLAEKIHNPASHQQRTFRILAAERTKFTLRCELDSFDAVVFVCCKFSWNGKRNPDPTKQMYIAIASQDAKSTAV